MGAGPDGPQIRRVFGPGPVNRLTEGAAQLLRAWAAVRRPQGRVSRDQLSRDQLSRDGMASAQGPETGNGQQGEEPALDCYNSGAPPGRVGR